MAGSLASWCCGSQASISLQKGLAASCQPSNFEFMRVKFQCLSPLGT